MEHRDSYTGPPVQPPAMYNDSQRLRPVNWAGFVSFFFTGLSAFVFVLGFWWWRTTPRVEIGQGDGKGQTFQMVCLCRLAVSLIAVVFGVIAIVNRRQTRGLVWGIVSTVISVMWLGLGLLIIGMVLLMAGAV